jgi:hypothetical protein
MGQTRMFRDRVVSMEQTLEGGEKHLPLLKDLCREALPGFEYKEHALDHERDLFVMDLQASDGTAKRIAWTRMVLFDAERIPTLTGDPAAALRGRIVEFLRSRAARPEIVVTFRHLEEGWVDTPEPRREGGRRRRRGGRGGRGGERAAPERRPRGPSGPAPGERRPMPQRPGGATPPSASAAEPGSASTPGGKRRRRLRRRRRGGRGPGGGAGSPLPPAPAPSGPRT